MQVINTEELLTSINQLMTRNTPTIKNNSNNNKTLKNNVEF